MMFLIGQGERIVVVGAPESRYCPRCDEETDFVPHLKYSYGQLDLVFGFVYNKRYQLACPKCHHGWLLDTAVMERTLGCVPIPFHLRHGIPIFVALATALSVAVYAYRHGGG